MALKDKLAATKKLYPFDNWRTLFYPDPEEDFEGMEQYSPENVNRAQKALDDLIANLLTLGEKASDQAKLEHFKTSILALNTANQEIPSFIETGEREDLCDLYDAIARAVGIEPEDYGDSIADEWREW